MDVKKTYKEFKMKIFGKRLRKARKSKRLTQQEIADLVHVNRVTYTNWEKGKREPSFENLVELADLLEVSLDWLFERDK